MTTRLDISTARELLDFAAGAAHGVVSPAVAEDQLVGAVAIHNMLATQGVAYLADEVGMGKTYVALGAMALLRHFQPSFRVMVIAPRENIQRKWIKEWRNFVSKIVKVEDLRVKSVGGHPARALVKVDTLVDLVTEASNDPDRDFFLRLTSFSVPVSASDGSLNVRRKQLLEALPWLDPELLNAQNKDRYKRNFGRAVNCALPPIDLLIVDEAHNLKGGWRDGASSTRNTVLGCALGGRPVHDPFTSSFRGYGRRIKRVLFLSATPIEHDIAQLWNQLDLLGFGNEWAPLKEKSLSHDQHRDVVRKLLIRRTAELHAGDTRLTKSEYRREWRGGGISNHDEPLTVTSDRQRLAVALVQKKVSELLGTGEHKHSFQVGLLASFESFLETVKSTTAEPRGAALDEDADATDDGSFHRTAEEVAANRNRPREGVDIDAVNRIARDHARVFHCEMPHPKMDSIVEELAKSFDTGRKALVFVRRVASVDELQRKLEERYDERLFVRLRGSLASPTLREQLDVQIAAYQDARAAMRHKSRARDDANGGTTGSTETSSVDSFFAWFFRGEGPAGIRSGASIAEQMDRATGSYSTLLEENHVATLLDVATDDVVSVLTAELGLSEAEALGRVAREASKSLGPRRVRMQRRVQMQAFQAAALRLLGRSSSRFAADAETVSREIFSAGGIDERQGWMVPGAADWLSTRTLFSELRLRPQMRAVLWPELAKGSFSERLRDRELRREFMSTMIRKGHPIIDLFIMIANRLGSLKQGSRELNERALPDLAGQFLDELERQGREESAMFNSFQELSEAASKFNLVVQLNAPELSETELARVPTLLGKALRAQRPVAGMAGKVNGEVVKQFRMPGYPLVLITTDLLKEGEDLHTFCSNVYHYGIAWMPSELEQRVGRVDRVGSQTERRLLALRGVPNGDDLLQVYYPHLNETVEVLQLKRVYERLNRFLRLMHEGLGAPPKEKANVSVSEEGLRAHIDTAAIKTPLRSAFNVSPAMLRGERRALAATVETAMAMRARLDDIECLLPSIGATQVRRPEAHQILGEMRLGHRVQPFTILLRSLRGLPVLRCVSPIGRIDEEDWDDELAGARPEPFTRIAVEKNDRFEAYDVAIEGDVLLGCQTSDAPRMTALVQAVMRLADRIEDELLHRDATLLQMSAGIAGEPNVAR